MGIKSSWSKVVLLDNIMTCYVACWNVALLYNTVLFAICYTPPDSVFTEYKALF